MKPWAAFMRRTWKGIDSEKPDTLEFAPFINIMSEWYAKDISKKVKTGIKTKGMNYDFVKECIGKSEFSIQTPQGEFTWKNTNEFLDENSPYYNANVKGMKTGTMASSYNIVVLYEKDGKAYLITCLAAHSNEGRYKAVQSAINTIIE